ncbi:MAG: ornithine carbamoyltransferase [Spirulinaceae cyanobacterium]
MGIQDLKGRDFLRITDLNSSEIKELLHLAKELKSGERSFRTHKELGLLFYKASTRTRVSFTVAMHRLGGQVIDLNPNVTQVGRGEPISDTARVLDRYLNILAIRTFKQEDLEIFAKYTKVPIVNALSDLEHPCQILADLLTIQESFEDLRGVNLAYLGDGNNVAHSLLLGCALMGINISLATPINHQPSRKIVEQGRNIAGDRSQVLLTDDPMQAVKNAQVIYTDVWASMGQEDLADSRLPVFQNYQVNGTILNNAHPGAIVLHCLPAHRGEEITEAVIEGKQSKVWEQAENRMHAQQALLAALLGLC